jgi:hypothetical protein
MYKLSVSIYSVSEGEIAQIPTFIADKVVIEGNVFVIQRGNR